MRSHDGPLSQPTDRPSHGTASHSIHLTKTAKTPNSRVAINIEKPLHSAIFPSHTSLDLAVTTTELDALTFCVKLGSKYTNRGPRFSTNRSTPHVDQPRSTRSAAAVYNRALAGRDI
jgi:hypothetical protein